MTTDRTRDLVGRLVYLIEDAPRTLHRDEIGSNRCLRLELGLVNTRPEDCDCGLDELLAEAHIFPAARTLACPATW